MHVILIHQAFVPPNEPGGTRHYELARRWVQDDHRFTIVAGDRNYLTGAGSTARRRLVEMQEIDGVRVARAYTYPSLHRSFVWRVASFVSFMFTSLWAGWRSGRADLIMGTSPPLFQALSAWLLSVLRRRPFLLEIRDLWPEFAIDIGVLKNPLLIAASRWVERFLYARATHLLVNSPAYRDYLIAKGVAAEKISLISNGVDPDMFDPAADGAPLRHEWGLEEKFIVSYTGALGMANDIPTILEAARQLRDDADIHFVIAGDGKERANLEATVRRENLDNVTMPGSIVKSKVAELLAASDACVATLKNIPMFRTTFPNKIFDYMAAGRPIVLAIDGVIREVVETAEGGIFVTPGDASALADAVRRLKSDPQQARNMGRRGRDYVVDHFNRHDQAVEFVELLERLIDPRSRRDAPCTASGSS